MSQTSSSIRTLARLAITLSLMALSSGVAYEYHLGIPFELTDAFLYTAMDPWLTVKHLLWPAMALSRLGLSYTFVALLVVPFFLYGLGIAIELRWDSSLGRRLGPWLPAGGYCLLALLYFWVLPVPLPVAPASESATVWTPKNLEAFSMGYEYAYREGTLDRWSNPHVGGAFAIGLAEGIVHGVAEYERVFPGLARSSIGNRVRDNLKALGESPSDL